MQENHYAEKEQLNPGNFKHHLPCLKTQAFLCFALPRMTTKIKNSNTNVLTARKSLLMNSFNLLLLFVTEL
jgi:hypothetical protein